MKTVNMYFLLILISIVLIYFYINCIKNNTDSEEEFINKSNLDEYGRPKKKIKRNVAYISVITNDILDIYLDKGSGLNKFEVDLKGQKIGRAFTKGGGNKVFNFQVPFSISNYDRLMFYNYNSRGGPIYWAGHIFLNNKFYPTNTTNYKLIGIFSPFINRPASSTTKTKGGFTPSYRRIGCFRDGPDRRLKKYIPGNHDYITCHDAAIRARKRYFAVQYGGQCFLGNNLRRAKSYGRQPEHLCAERSWNRRNGSKWGTGGNGWTNDIHDTKTSAKIRYYGDNKGIWPSLRNFNNVKGGISKFTYGTYALQPDIGGAGTDRGFRINKFGENFAGRWVQYEFFIEYVPEIEFCPHVGYTEYNPAGCKHPERSDRCIRSANPGFKANMGECITRSRPLFRSNNYNNKTVYTIMNDFFNTVNKFDRNVKKFKRGNQEKKVRKLIKKAKGYFKMSAKLACDIAESKSEFDFKNKYQCKKKLVKSIISTNADDNKTFLFNDVLSIALKSPKGLSSANDPDKTSLNKLKRNLIQFLDYARMVIFQANSLFLNCTCIDSTTDCAPC